VAIDQTLDHADLVECLTDDSSLSLEHEEETISERRKVVQA